MQTLESVWIPTRDLSHRQPFALRDDTPAGSASIATAGGLFGSVPLAPASVRSPIRRPVRLPDPKNLEIAIGYAHVFGVDCDGTKTREPFYTVSGAFQKSLASGRNFKALVEHDPKAEVASTHEHSLRLGEDSVGLWAAIWLDKSTVLGRLAIDRLRSGYYAGMSIMRTPIKSHVSSGRNRHYESDLEEVSFVRRGACSPCMAILASDPPKECPALRGEPIDGNAEYMRRKVFKKLLESIAA